MIITTAIRRLLEEMGTLNHHHIMEVHRHLPSHMDRPALVEEDTEEGTAEGTEDIQPHNCHRKPTTKAQDQA